MRTLHIAHYKTIALVIHSVDRSLQEINPKGWCAVRTLHIAHYKTIALAIHSLDRSLQEFNPKGWCAVRTLHIAHYKTIALVIHSVDRTLHIATRLSPSLSTRLILHIAHYKLPLATSHCFLGEGRRQFFGVRPRSRVQAEKPYPA